MHISIGMRMAGWVATAAVALVGAAASAVAQQRNGRGELRPVEVQGGAEVIAPGDLPEVRERRVSRDVVEPAAPEAPSAPPADVKAEIDAARPALLACRGEVALERRKDVSDIPAGAVELRFTIAPDGAVQGAEIVALSSTSPDVLACVERKVAGWRFLATRPTPLRVAERLLFPRAPR